MAYARGGGCAARHQVGSPGTQHGGLLEDVRAPPGQGSTCARAEHAGNGYINSTWCAGVGCSVRAHPLRERQVDGMAAAKAADVYKGREPISVEKQEQIRALAALGVPKAAIARKLAGWPHHCVWLRQ